MTWNISDDGILTMSGTGNNEDITLSNIHFAKTNAQDVQFADMTLGTATAIKNINENDNEDDNLIYDLSGRKLSHAQKGVNIINGKKIIK